MPPPMQRVARPFLTLRRAISCKSVVRTRAREARIGCQIAIAPPLTLTIAGSQPRSLFTASAWAAKASFASTSSRSLTDQPAFSSALRGAGIGPVPMIAGSTPAVAQETMRAIGVSPRRLASSPLKMADAGALAGAYRRRDVFVFEPSGLLRRLGLVLRADGESILLFAGDLPLFRDVFRGGAHMIAVKGVDQDILKHGVDELHLSHLHTTAQIGRMGGERHRFLATRNDNVGVAVCDLLQSKRNRTQAAAA